MVIPSSPTLPSRSSSSQPAASSSSRQTSRIPANPSESSNPGASSHARSDAQKNPKQARRLQTSESEDDDEIDGAPRGPRRLTKRGKFSQKSRRR